LKTELSFFLQIEDRDQSEIPFVPGRKYSRCRFPRVPGPRSPDFPFSPLEELALILSSRQLDVKETKNKLIPAQGGWRLICIKDE
jgi:hypothetical protein